MNCWDTRRILGVWPLTGMILTVLVSLLTSVHLSFANSPGSAPVALSPCKNVPMTLLAAEINWSNSCSVGMKGKLSACAYFGRVHVMFSILRKLS